MVSIDTLRQFGVTTAESARLNTLSSEQGKQELRQQLEAYTNEVLENQPVSLPYSYWFGKDQALYTDQSCQDLYQATSQFDPKERGGKYLIGFDQLTKDLRRNPGKVVLWYSPIGPASFDNDPDNPYTQINYDYGQLYVNFYDGKKVNALAVKIGNEEVVKLFFPESYFFTGQADPQSIVSQFATRPFLTGLDIDDFLSHCPNNDFVYRGNHNEKYYLQDILLKIRDAFAGRKKTPVNTFDRTIDELYQYQITEERLLRAYLQAIYAYQQKTHQPSMSLSGSCGGSQVDQKDIESILTSGSPVIKKVTSLHSSTIRYLTQKDPTHYSDYECPHCHSKLSGEKKGDTQSWKTECPHCKGKLGCREN